MIEIVNGVEANKWKGEESGKYNVYLLIKRGMDHFNVLRELEEKLRTKIHYLGIKDTNAVTEQIIYTESKKNEYIENLDTTLYSLKFLGKASNKFTHNGNKFIIIFETSDIKELESRVKEIKRIQYLPAFFGYQRFGSKRPITHVIGKLLLFQEWCESIKFIVGYIYSSEQDITKKARSLYMKGELEKSLREFSSNFKQEKIIIRNISKTQNCYNSIKNSFIPLRFYIEAYQSYLFNRILSREIDNINPSEYPDKIIRVPLKKMDCENETCKEIFDEEGIDNLNVLKDIKIGLRPLTRKAFMPIKNLEMKGTALEFVLDRGMYATVLLRELTHEDPRSFT